MSNWGGKRTGAGRKPAPIKNKLIQRLDEYIDDVEVIEALRLPLSSYCRMKLRRESNTVD